MRARRNGPGSECRPSPTRGYLPFPFFSIQAGKLADGGNYTLARPSDSAFALHESPAFVVNASALFAMSPKVHAAIMPISILLRKGVFCTTRGFQRSITKNTAGYLFAKNENRRFLTTAAEDGLTCGWEVLTLQLFEVTIVRLLLNSLSFVRLDRALLLS